MVWFQCEDCGEELKKPKLAAHFNRCSAYKLSCIDCGVTFDQESVKGHNQCISEAEKYGPKSQGKPGSTPQAKPDKPKPNSDVDINVGLSTRPPWLCSLCNTTTTSQQTLLLHAEGKKHRAKARAFHAKNQPAGGTQESNSVPVPPTDAPVSQTGEINTANGQNHSNRDLKGEERSVKRKREDQKTEEQNGQVVEAEKVDNKFEKKKKVKGPKEDVDSEIKWKKIITSILKSKADGAMKIKKLQKEVVRSLRECGITKDKDQLHDELISKISSSSRFLVEDKYVKLVVKES